jgi:hypothetical protein
MNTLTTVPEWDCCKNPVILYDEGKRWGKKGKIAAFAAPRS